jgi:hypothetical protein
MLLSRLHSSSSGWHPPSSRSACTLQVATCVLPLLLLEAALVNAAAAAAVLSGQTHQ